MQKQGRLSITDKDVREVVRLAEDIISDFGNALALLKRKFEDISAENKNKDIDDFCRQILDGYNNLVRKILPVRINNYWEKKGITELVRKSRAGAAAVSRSLKIEQNLIELVKSIEKEKMALIHLDDGQTVIDTTTYEQLYDALEEYEKKIELIKNQSRKLIHAKQSENMLYGILMPILLLLLDYPSDFISGTKKRIRERIDEIDKMLNHLASTVKSGAGHRQSVTDRMGYDENSMNEIYSGGTAFEDKSTETKEETKVSSGNTGTNSHILAPYCNASPGDVERGPEQWKIFVKFLFDKMYSLQEPPTKWEEVNLMSVIYSYFNSFGNISESERRQLKERYDLDFRYVIEPNKNDCSKNFITIKEWDRLERRPDELCSYRIVADMLKRALLSCINNGNQGSYYVPRYIWVINELVQNFGYSTDYQNGQMSEVPGRGFYRYASDAIRQVISGGKPGIYQEVKPGSGKKVHSVKREVNAGWSMKLENKKSFLDPALEPHKKQGEKRASEEILKWIGKKLWDKVKQRTEDYIDEGMERLLDSSIKLLLPVLGVPHLAVSLIGVSALAVAPGIIDFFCQKHLKKSLKEAISDGLIGGIEGGIEGGLKGGLKGGLISGLKGTGKGFLKGFKSLSESLAGAKSGEGIGKAAIRKYELGINISASSYFT